MQEEFACSLHMDSIINSSQDSPAEGAKCKRAPLWKVISLAKLIIFPFTELAYTDRQSVSPNRKKHITYNPNE